MTSTARDIIAARHSQTRNHNAIARRNLPTLLRIDTSNADPIVAVYIATSFDHATQHADLVGWYMRLGEGANEPWSRVMAGDRSPLFTDGANLVRCDDDGSW